MSKIHYLLFLMLIIILILSGSFFTLNQRYNAVIFQFGEAVSLIEKPGLNMKIPFIQNVEFFDKRILNVTSEAKELTAADGKRIIVDAFAKFKITNPITFFKTVHNDQGAKLRINRILESSMRKIIGQGQLNNLLSNKRAGIMLLIKDLVHEESKAFGIDIIDVKILKADLPTENSDAIYRRMQTEREKEAKQIRAEGYEESAHIISKADKESKIILANAYMEAQKIKGDGDANAAKIYNNAYKKDHEFYKFYRSLVAYQNCLNSNNTQFIISPKSEFFQYLKLGK